MEDWQESKAHATHTTGIGLSLGTKARWTYDGEGSCESAGDLAIATGYITCGSTYSAILANIYIIGLEFKANIKLRWDMMDISPHVIALAQYRRKKENKQKHKRIYKREIKYGEKKKERQKMWTRRESNPGPPQCEWGIIPLNHKPAWWKNNSI